MFHSSQVVRHYGKGLFLPVHSNRHHWLETHSSDGQVWESQLEDLAFKALVKAFYHEVRVQRSQSLQKLRSANSRLHWKFMVSRREAGVVGTMPWSSHSPSMLLSLWSPTIKIHKLKLEVLFFFFLKAVNISTPHMMELRSIDLSKQVEAKQISCETLDAIKSPYPKAVRHQMQ